MPSLKKQKVTYVSQMTSFSWTELSTPWKKAGAKIDAQRRHQSLSGTSRPTLTAPEPPLSSTGWRLTQYLPLCDHRDCKSARVMTPHQLAEFTSYVSYAIPAQHLQLDSQPMTPAAGRISPRIHARLYEGFADTYFISSAQSVHGFSSFLDMH